jgi:LysR family transcriptional regulator, glycine cleavage system transcriptional activator
MNQRLPSLASLRAFEAAARHMSFTRAAAELNLTQTAISHQIRNLEEQLGLSLFQRERNTLLLTEAARDYLDTVRAVLLQLAEATNRTADRARESVLTLACLNTFAIKCLLPALGEFRAIAPGLSLRIRTVISFENLPRHDYDVAIRYGVGEWPGLVSRRITWDEVFPVCAPALARGRRLRRPADLANHVCIRTVSPNLRDDWPLWLDLAGLRDLVFVDELASDFLATSLQAAADGLGIAIGRSAVVADDLAQGRLVAPFPLRVPTRLGYHVAAPADRANKPKVAAFTNWATTRFAALSGPAPES